MIAKRFDGAIFILYNAASMKMFWKDIFAFGWLAAVRSVFALVVLGGGALAEENSFAKINWKTVTPAELDAAIADGKLDANAPFGDGNFPPLWHAVSKSNNLDLLDVLVRHGAEINQTSTALGMTALHLAAYQGRVEQIRRLLEMGADVNLRDGAGKPVVFHALRGGGYENSQQRKTALDLLSEYGADMHAAWLPPDEDAPVGIMAYTVGSLYDTGPETYNGVLSHLSSLGADVNYILRGGMSVMHLAAVLGDSEDGVLQELLTLGGDVNAGGEGAGATPLMLLVRAGHDISMFDYLVEAGADIDIKDDNGMSVLTYARLRKNGYWDIEYQSAYFPKTSFSGIDQFRAFGDKIIARIESLCENREYEVCAELDEDFEAGDSVKLSDILNDGKEG